MRAAASERVLVLLALLIVAVALFASTFGQTFSGGGDVAQQPMFFPRIVLGLWAALALAALVQAVLAGEGVAPIASWTRIGVVLLAIVVYANAIAWEGFFVPSVVFALVCLPAFGIRNPLVVAAFAVAVPGALVALFNHGLGMPLPTSRFTYLF
ncbi:tripartite tricarboxylate transporter TctB family protein [Jannaschia sp. LMIT008]|uniref:tripartite tricarboxylate transporter TctB family protein n=1 Tax=Jannaschia maritima TaxID=3032585 RepID=UPI0028113EE9|nr:tripartite tricarboxylate transporter TctB family protein [Jannaschia sp. LMIT008]